MHKVNCKSRSISFLGHPKLPGGLFVIILAKLFTLVNVVSHFLTDWAGNGMMAGKEV